MGESVTPRGVAGFDSASAMVQALGRFLRGQDFPRVGASALATPLAPVINALPRRVREAGFTWSGWREALPPDETGRVRSEEIARWITSAYPRRPYPAVMIGSASGAVINLCAALGIPWLPQTTLLLVRCSDVDIDKPRAILEAGKTPATALLTANPDLALHHMHDANQDRLMVHRVEHFRLKRRRLGEALEAFLAETLIPGGTIFLAECRRSWPTTRVADRYVFQLGGVGGATPEEYLGGSPRVTALLGRYGSRHQSWDAPEPDGERPEAEWGFDPALREDVTRFAQARGYRVRRILFDEPDNLSPLVADLYRRWYQERGIDASRLLVQTFVQLEPWWTLRTGSVPFWLVFSVEPAARRLERYLDHASPFDDIRLTLFSHGTDSIGLAPVERWRVILNRASTSGSFLGTDTRAYPWDFAAYLRYSRAVQQLPNRVPMPSPLSLEQLDAFLAEVQECARVRWIDGDGIGTMSAGSLG
ncbi:MAG: hypothetical protein M3Q03_00625 [Chloroflexota bacterium]|nr:hypothetical protein [Chloroflexota bacterium]